MYGASSPTLRDYPMRHRTTLLGSTSASITIGSNIRALAAFFPAIVSAKRRQVASDMDSSLPEPPLSSKARVLSQTQHYSDRIAPRSSAAGILISWAVPRSVWASYEIGLPLASRHMQDNCGSTLLQASLWQGFRRRSQQILPDSPREPMPINDELAAMRSHRNRIHRYSQLLERELPEHDRSYLEGRLSEECRALRRLTDAVFPIALGLPRRITLSVRSAE